ncbi:UNVERIFIED_CONTAM: protein ROOT INITIATION defective [Sesamum calycinum]|uniref:Protein ROOT INITIATION defective n=1 Tax=Sesamum calycinum TaxID=2727403 RepID=A0AAW2P9Y9_9LAMI
METEVVIASSPTDAGISCWDLHTGAEHLRYKSCASPSHGLTSSPALSCLSQIRESKSSSSSGSILFGPGARIFDDARREEMKHLFEYSFHEHSLRVTDVKTGYGGSNAIIVSASEDRTCKVWSLSKGKILRNVVFPSIIDAISLDPGEHVFYAGGRDGPVNNVLVIRQPKYINPRTSASSLASAARRQGLTLPPPLEKFANSPDENPYVKVLIGPQTLPNQLLDSPYISVQTMEAQIKELQQQGSSAAAEVDVERLKSEQLSDLDAIHGFHDSPVTQIHFHKSECASDFEIRVSNLSVVPFVLAGLFFID